MTNSKSSIFFEGLFELADNDKDGFITFEELSEAAEEYLTHCIPDKAFDHLAANTS